MATTTKIKKVEEHHPPVDVRDNTKARRAWLADKAAELNALPGVRAKVVGQGSYQYVSEYHEVVKEGRLRHRGNCQACGGLQVAEEGSNRLVLHGYKRPGDGATYGRCPGTNSVPLQIDDTKTQEWLWQSKNDLAEIEQELDEANRRGTDARLALYGGEERREPNAWRDMPRKHSRPTQAELAEYVAAKKVWEQDYPLTATYERIKRECEALERSRWQTKQMIAHYEYWLAKKLTGTPLIKEVV